VERSGNENAVLEILLKNIQTESQVFQFIAGFL
jgi:hypothetical protein